MLGLSKSAPCIFQWLKNPTPRHQPWSQVSLHSRLFMSQGRRTRHFGVSILPSSRASGEMPRSPRLAHVRLIECTNVRWLVEFKFPTRRARPIRKHHPDLGSDASSVWNFCARFSDVFGRETSGSMPKCRLFSQATTTVQVKNLTSILTFKFPYGQSGSVWMEHLNVRIFDRYRTVWILPYGVITKRRFTKDWKGTEHIKKQKRTINGFRSIKKRPLLGTLRSNDATARRTSLKKWLSVLSVCPFSLYSDYS